MRVGWSRGLLAALTIAACVGAASVRAETPPADAPPSATPTSPEPPSAPASDDDFQWLSMGAVAECRDGSFFHGKPEPRACTDHGGIRRWMRDHEQDLIR